MAEGPMSTPRRSWPRSMGTPKIPAGCRACSSKGSAPAASRISGCLEEAIRDTPDRVDPTEVHRGFLVGEYLLVAVEVCRAGAGLVGEESALGVEARGEDSALQRHPEVEHVHEGLQNGRGDARCPRRAYCYEASLLGGDDGRAHARDQTLPGTQRMEALGIELRLA